LTGDDEVSLVDAVAASTAAPGFRPPATIAGPTFIDGGTASCTNVDLARDYDRIVVIAPGWNPMSPTRRADAARAGRNQAAAAAPAVRRVRDDP